MPLNSYVNSEGQITTKRDWYVDRTTTISMEVWTVEAIHQGDNANKNTMVFTGPQAKELSLAWESLLKVILP